MKRVLPLIALLLLPACRGTRPARYGDSRLGFAAVLVRGRIVTKKGATLPGYIALNLESDGGEKYRLIFEGDRTTFLRIEPDVYRLHPTRNMFGLIKNYITVRINKTRFRVPFPREILRKDVIDAKPTRVVPIGVLEARILSVGGRDKRPKIVVHLDDSVTARRLLIEETIDSMMDPKTEMKVRDSAISWTRALENALVDLQGEERRAPSFKPSR